jgi:hypothetical protein
MFASSAQAALPNLTAEQEGWRGTALSVSRKPTQRSTCSAFVCLWQMVEANYNNPCATSRLQRFP